MIQGGRYPIEPASIGEMPLVGSRALIDRIDGRLRDLLRALGPRLARRPDPDWPLAPAADVLSADLAVVAAPDTALGWDLRWVEFQTFTSLVSLIYTLHRASAELWPELAAMTFWEKGLTDEAWRAATRRWMAPEPGSILLEDAPWSQPTRPDFEAAQHWFGVSVTAPESLRVRRGRLEHCDANGRWHPVPHIANRLILRESPERDALLAVLSPLTLGWHSHPVWYDRVHKGVMAEVPLPAGERCVRADRWRDLGLPAREPVAKRCYGRGGRGLRMRPDAAALDGLQAPEDWIVQPRFSPMPLLTARDGAPLYGEIRCVVALPEGGEPWLVCRLARMTRGPVTSAAGWSGAPGEGAVPIYAPPD